MNSSYWLLAGMLAGLGTALWNMLLQPPTALPEAVIARVDGQDIARRDWLRAVEGAEQARRSALDDDERRAILQRLIDEHLLISYGLELDLVRQTPRLRKQTVDTVLQLLRADAAVREPDDAELQAFYRDHQAYFGAPEQRELRVYRHTERAPLQRQHDALQAGRPGPLAPDPGVPQALLPLPKLRGLLGPALTDRAAAMPGPGLSPIVETPEGFALIQALRAEPGHAPPLEQIRERVAAEWRRREAEAEFQRLLADLRQRYPVQTAPLP